MTVIHRIRHTKLQRKSSGRIGNLKRFRFDHVAVRVNNYAVAVRWYKQKLDFQVQEKWRSRNLRLAYLRNGNVKLEIIAGGDPRPSVDPRDLEASLARSGYHHFCLMVDDLDVTLKELGRRGVQAFVTSFKVSKIRRRLAFIKDNSGNLIELAQKI